MTNSSSHSADNQRYLELLQEFEILRLEPGNEKYCTSTRGVDYLNLIVVAMSGGVDDFVPQGHPDRIVYLFNELSYVLEPASQLQLLNLKQFLEQHSYSVTVAGDLAGYTVTIHAPTFDFVVLID